MREGLWGRACARAMGAATLAATLLLGACGGGHDTPPPLAVTVKVDGVASQELADGSSEVIEVASGATLAFESAGETRWAPAATDSSFHVNSFSFTSKSLTVTSYTGGTLVVVFTDKADSTQKATLTVNVAPQEFQHVARVDGEVEVQSLTSTDAAGAVTQRDLYLRTVLMDQGAYGLDIGNGPDDYSGQRSLYDAQDRYLGFAFPALGTDCRYDNPVAYVSYPMHVGRRWAGSATRNCNGNPFITSQDYSRSVEAYEHVVVPEGTHGALRIKAEAHYTVTNSDDDTIVDHYSTISTCWWAVDLGRNVKCNYVFEYEDGSSDSRVDVLTSLTR